jgi:hypothetical protein
MVLKIGRFENRSDITGKFRWCWRRMEKIIWTDRVRMKKCYKRSQGSEEYSKNNKKRNANWIGHILPRNCLLKHVFEGKIDHRIEVTGRRGRRRNQLLDDLKEKRGYCKFK